MLSFQKNFGVQASKLNLVYTVYSSTPVRIFRLNTVSPSVSLNLEKPNSLQNHAYSKILKISPPKTESFQIKILIFFIFLLKTYIVGNL